MFVLCAICCCAYMLEYTVHYMLYYIYVMMHPCCVHSVGALLVLVCALL